MNPNILTSKEAIHISLRNENELMIKDKGVEIDGWWNLIWRQRSRSDLEHLTDAIAMNDSEW